MYRGQEGWDVFVTGDYLYWKLSQDDAKIITEVTKVGDVYRGDSKVILQNPGYASGFQVGLGFNMKGMDYWNLYAEYSWYRNTDHESASTSSNTAFQLAKRHVEGTMSVKQKFGYQTLDFLAQRPFYWGRKLTANFGAGLRAQWISLDISSHLNGVIVENERDISSTITYDHSTWSLGPKFSLNTSWLLGYGLKVLANLAGSALYTSYNVTATGNFPVSRTDQFFHNYGTIRPVLESFLGLGWGSYFCNDNCHLDLSIGYDFNVYWDYTMRFVGGDQVVASMYLQGMNIQARFDF